MPSVLATQFVVNRTMENNRSQLFKGISNHTVEKIVFSEIEMTAGMPAVTGVAPTLLELYIPTNRSVTLTLNNGGSSFVLPGVSGLFVLKSSSPISYSLAFPSGSDFTLKLVHD